MIKIGLFRDYFKVTSHFKKKLKKGTYNSCTIIFKNLSVAFNNQRFMNRLNKHFKKMDSKLSYVIDDKENEVIVTVKLNETSKYFSVIDCNKCAFLNLTEEEQINLGRGIKEIHRCNFFGVRVFHDNRTDGYLYPSSRCNGTMFSKRIKVKGEDL